MRAVPNQTLDLIYEAAAVPELWPGVLNHLAEIAGGAGTFLITTDPRNFRWTSSESLRELGFAIIEGGYLERNPRMERLLARHQAGFLREVDMFSATEMDADPTFTELLRPRGFGWAAGTVVQVPSDDMLAFSIERRFADGPVDDEAIVALNALRPHLARAALMSARLRLERARGMAEALTTMGLPSAVFLGDGRIIATSPQFEQLGAQIVSRSFGRIALASQRANGLLSEAMENLEVDGIDAGAKSIAVPARDGNAAIVVHVLPVRRAAREVFGPAMGILVAMPLGTTRTLPADLLNGLFDLSPAEIRAVNGLLQRKTPDNLASEFGLSRETIRSQVKAAFAKLGTNSQADLVALLGNVSVPTWHRPVD